MEMEYFDHYVGMLTLAKTLHDMDRFDIVEKHFQGIMCFDFYYENVLGVISSIFSDYNGDYRDGSDTEIMEFGDAVISEYFVYAWEFGKQQNIPFNDNPYVAQAREEVRTWLDLGCCADSKLLAYVRTKKSAQQSKLLIRIGIGCGNCSMHENVAYGLIKLFIWFAGKCDEFKKLKELQEVEKFTASTAMDAKFEPREVMAA